MADLYPPYTRPFPPQQDDHDHDHDLTTKDSPTPKNESKPQATFLTKLYALLERPENHHMIRWDPQGEHIIVERPEQLALHVLPSIYRQSRFASFSRQLNIYGFMRKVNLRNVDPAIDDPDASTWSHPTLNRHSPPEVVANFKRRVPPRMPKPRKREVQEPQMIPPPRSAIGVGPGSVPLTVPSMPGKIGQIGRSRGFSAPGSFNPAGTAAWANNYSRSALPPLTVPSEPHHLAHAGYGSPADESPTTSYGTYSQYYPDSSSSQWSFSPTASSSHNGSLSSLLNPPSNSSNTNSVYAHSSRPTPTINTSVHSSGGYSSPFSSMPLHSSDGTTHSASSLSPDGHSRPPTGYSMSSVSSMSYDDYGSNSRPGSSHRQFSTSPRPPSSRSPYHATSNSSLSIRRARRHSQAMSPYPSPYDHGGGSSSSGSLTEHQRPSTSPQPDMHHGHHNTHHGGHHSHHSEHPGSTHILPRVRSMIQLPSVDTSASGTSPYSYNPNTQAEFAYSPLPSAASTSSVSVPSLASVPSSSSISSMSSMHSHHSHHDTYGPSRSSAHGGRPGTAASSMSVASGSSQANTPPMDGGAGAYDVGINSGGVGVNDASMVRGYEPDFGFVAMGEHEHLQAGYGAKDI